MGECHTLFDIHSIRKVDLGHQRVPLQGRRARRLETDTCPCCLRYSNSYLASPVSLCLTQTNTRGHTRSHKATLVRKGKLVQLALKEVNRQPVPPDPAQCLSGSFQVFIYLTRPHPSFSAGIYMLYTWNLGSVLCQFLRDL